MSLDYKHDLNNILTPEALEYLETRMKDVCLGDDLLNAPFVRTKLEGLESHIIFWKPKDVFDVDDGSVTLGISYCEYLLRMCARQKNAALFAFIIAAMIKSGAQDKLAAVFLDQVAQYALVGFGSYNMACWIRDVCSETGYADFSWLMDR